MEMRMTIEWTKTDRGQTALVARLMGFELHVNPFGHENADGPLWIAALFDEKEALADKTWAFHVKDINAAKAHALALLKEYLTAHILRQTKLLEAVQNGANEEDPTCPTVN